MFVKAMSSYRRHSLHLSGNVNVLLLFLRIMVVLFINLGVTLSECYLGVSCFVMKLFLFLLLLATLPARKSMLISK